MNKYIRIDVPITGVAIYLVEAPTHSAAFSKLQDALNHANARFQDGLKLMGQRDIEVNKDMATWKEVSPEECPTCGHTEEWE